LVCADTNTWIAYLEGKAGADVEVLDEALASRSVKMAPVVLSELLSDPLLPPRDERDLVAIPLLELRPGFWRRAGKSRSSLIRRELRPKLADTLIAQACVDHEMLLLTRDRDFSGFARHCGLRLFLGS
jgi:predicted nucleic acid-binding protein